MAFVSLVVVITRGDAVVPDARARHVVPSSVLYWYVEMDAPPSDAGAVKATDN